MSKYTKNTTFYHSQKSAKNRGRAVLGVNSGNLAVFSGTTSQGATDISDPQRKLLG